MTLTATQNVTVLSLTATQSGVSVSVAPVIDATGGGGGTVTSVAQTVPTGFTVAGSPITDSGTLAISYDTGYEGFTSTQASAISTNSAKVSFPEAPNDGTQYARKNLGWEAVAGGGTEYQNYDLTFWTDGAGATVWHGIPVGRGTSEYDAWFNVLVTNSATTIVLTDLLSRDAFGVAVGNQTVVSFRLMGQGINDVTTLTNVSLIKVTFTDNPVYGVIDSITALFEGAVTFDAKGSFTLAAGDFSVTSISDRDVIYMFIGTSSPLNIGCFIANLKCSID